MEVLQGEGVANHTGPEPCVGIREGECEASVGELTAQPLSRIRIEPGRRRRCKGTRQHVRMRELECSDGPAWS